MLTTTAQASHATEEQAELHHRLTHIDRHFGGQCELAGAVKPKHFSCSAA